MLPYRLRPPVYGGPLKWLKAKQESENAHAGGGPLQQAIERDLAALETDFFRKLRTDYERGAAADDSNNEHSRPGKIFGIFKEVFGASKVGLLFSFVPPRCNPESFSQLIYASCLSLLKDAFQAEPYRLEKAAFSMFCLYALYRTNPLPKLPAPPFPRHSALDQSTSDSDTGANDPKVTECINMLPLALKSAESSKNLFRRSFAPRIRIDRSCFGLVLQTRDEARARQGLCERRLCAARMKKLESRMKQRKTHEKPAFTKIRLKDMLASSSEDDSDEEIPDQSGPGWICVCGIARDTIEIIDRILNEWDFCDYTGPVCLEGLAGHADYPFANKGPMPNAAPARSKLPINSTSHLAYLDDLLTEELPSEESTNNDPLKELREKFNGYQKAIRTIRFPRGAQAHDRAKKSLKPLLESAKKRGTWERFQQHMNGVVIDAGNEASPTKQDENEEEEKAVSKTIGFDLTANTTEFISQEGDDEQSKSHEELPRINLNLPENLSVAAKDAIRSSINVLFKREGGSLFESSQRNPGSLMPSRWRSHDDDLSTIGYGGVSVTSGIGQSAIQELLASAQNKQSIPRIAEVPVRLNKANDMLLGRSFFDVDSLVKPRPKANKQSNHQFPLYQADPDASDISDGSDLSDIDEDVDDSGGVLFDTDKASVSVATSACGNHALNTLLANITNVTGGKELSGAARATKSADSDSEGYSVSLGVNEAEISTLLSQVSRKHRRSIASKANQKKPAAGHHPQLKNRFNAEDGHSLGHSGSVATTAAGGKALMALLSHVGQANDSGTITNRSVLFDGEGATEDSAGSIATSAFGQRALQMLLSKVPDQKTKPQPRKAYVLRSTKATAGAKQGSRNTESAEEDASGATSAAGERALQTLFSKAFPVHEPQRKSPNRQKSASGGNRTPDSNQGDSTIETSAFCGVELDGPLNRETKSEKNKNTDIGDDDAVSVATSAMGGRALRALLAQAPAPAPAAERTDAAVESDAASAASAATSAMGGRALRTLLAQKPAARKRKARASAASQPRRSSPAKRKRKQEPEQESDTIEGGASTINDTGGDDQSMATSAVGGQALQALLLRASSKSKS